VKMASIVLLATGSGVAQSGWIRNVNTDKMTGKTAVIYSVVSTSSEGTTYPRKPQLSVICENRHVKSIDYWVDAVLAVDNVEGGQVQSFVQYKMDDKRLRKDFWNQPSDSKHVFTYDLRIKELLASNSLMLRIGTFTGDVVTDEFKVGGLDTTQFHEDCGK
jgi:hypothetical protein